MKTSTKTMTVAELEQRYHECVSQAARIETQLADRNRVRTQTGDRMSDKDYWTWRGSATHALQLTLEEQRSLKAQLKGARAELTAANGIKAGFDLKTPLGLLRASHAILRRFASETGSVEADEADLLDALREYLTTQVALEITVPLFHLKK